MIDDHLRRLVDRQEIVDRMHAYARWVDINRPDEQVKVFTEDCRVNYGKGDDGWITGRDALERVLREALAAYVATNHSISNIEIDFVDPDTATATSYVHAWHRVVDPRPDYHLYGRYPDVWRRTPDGWRMVERRVTVAGTVGATETDQREPIERRSST
jgi:hypothetical protein